MLLPSDFDIFAPPSVPGSRAIWPSIAFGSMSTLR